MRKKVERAIEGNEENLENAIPDLASLAHILMLPVVQVSLVV